MAGRCAIAAAGLLAGFFVLTSPARAIWLSESGSVATLSGPFATGDETIFKAFLDKPRSQPIRVLYLSSAGGKINPAMAIGRMVRNAGITTVVDADSASCASACTYVFVAGVRRHYVNGGNVTEGMNARNGLGFHPVHRDGGRNEGKTFSDKGSERVRAYYAQMGTPRAAELMDKAAFDTFYRPNGQTALTLRIATSLSAP
ncbi:hypothetical protein J2Y55_001870 [Bosea sp. BE125]|uniref:COG3904 family protein n=1 Tax=Bosea sp. BE125 TaxID=2817909 RepID=UPI00286711DB|nr:hypothetical protein [Bosea sp. BE125]MDR6870862.1 hypothetical protein [Bosea sp. BE125]